MSLQGALAVKATEENIRAFEQRVLPWMRQYDEAVIPQTLAVVEAERRHPIGILRAVLRNEPPPDDPHVQQDWTVLEEPERLIILHMKQFCRDFDATPDPS